MTGIAMGVARLVPILEKMGKFEGLNLSPSVYMVSISESVRSKAIELAQMLRQAGVSVDMDLLGRGVSRQLNNANRKGIRRAVIVGEREVQDGCIIIRDMASAEQKKVKFENVLDKLLER
jgi:histidyl-tRNA synthetase